MNEYSRLLELEEKKKKLEDNFMKGVSGGSLATFFGTYLLELANAAPEIAYLAYTLYAIAAALFTYAGASKLGEMRANKALEEIRKGSYSRLS